MYAIFETIEAYLSKLAEINISLGYPNSHGTEIYCSETPRPTKDGKYAMPITSSIAGMVWDCVVVAEVEWESCTD